MEELLKKALELVGDLTREYNDSRQKTAECNQLAAKLRIDRDNLDKKEAEIKAREVAVSQGESPIKAAEEARRLKSENATLSIKIQEERDLLEKEKREFGQYVSKTRQELNKKEVDVNAEREENRRVRDELKEKEKTMKDDFLKEIGKKLK